MNSLSDCESSRDLDVIFNGNFHESSWPSPTENLEVKDELLGPWMVAEISPYRMILSAETIYGEVYYDPYLRKVTGNKRLPSDFNLKPSEELIEEYELAFFAKPPPELLQEDESNIIYLKQNSSIIYDPELNLYKNRINGKKIYGIRKPIRDQEFEKHFIIKNGQLS